MNTICLQCFCSIPGKGPCPKCGWQPGKTRNPSGALPLGSILNDRYQIGGVLRQAKDQLVYQAWDSHKRTTVEITEFLPPGQTRQGKSFAASRDAVRQKRRWKRWSSFEQNQTAYAVNLPDKIPTKHGLLAAMLLFILLLGIGGWKAISLGMQAKVWLPASAPQEYAAFLRKRCRVSVMEDAEYTPRLLQAAEEGNLPDVFYRDGFTGELDRVARPVDPQRLEMGDCSLLRYQQDYPSCLEVPAGWYATVAYTHTHSKTISSQQLFSGENTVCIAEDNWDDLMIVWTGSLSEVQTQLKQVQKVYQKQKTNPNWEEHAVLFTQGKIDWLVDDTLQRDYFTQYGCVAALAQQGRMAGCFAAHWCLGTDENRAYEVIEQLLSREGQEVLFPAGQALFPLSDEAMKQVVSREPELAFLTEQKETLLLFGESRGIAYRKNNQMYQEIKENYEE